MKVSPLPSLSVKKAVLSLAAVFALAASAMAAGKEQIVYSTGFEGPEFAAGQQIASDSSYGWYGSGDSASTIVKITDEAAHGGKQCLMMSDQNPSGTPTAGRNLPTTLVNAEISLAIKSADAETTFRIEARDAETVNFMVIHGWNDQLGGNGFYVRTQKGDKVVPADYIKGVLDSEISYDPTVWNLVSCKFDDKAKTFSLSINGKVVLAIKDESRVTWQISRMNLATGWSAGASPSLVAYFDDLVVKTNR